MEDDDDEGSVTRIIRRMQKGDGDGAALLWERFYVRLKYLMKDRLRDQLHPVADEEDVALESLAEMFKGLLDGKYPSLDSRESFWRLLVTVSSRNVLDEINRENRQKRGASSYTAASLRAATGQTLGAFRWIIWRVSPVNAIGGGENTAFQEFDVEFE